MLKWKLKPDTCKVEEYCHGSITADKMEEPNPSDSPSLRNAAQFSQILIWHRNESQYRQWSEAWTMF